MHIVELTVRGYELDSYNHVNNSVYLNYLEHARMQFLHHVGFNYKGLFEAGFHLYVTGIDIKYKSPALLDDKLFIEVKPLKLKKISGEFSQVIKKEDGSVCAEAIVSWACIDSKIGRPSKIPDEFMVEGLIP